MSPTEIERIVHAGVPLAAQWEIAVLEAADGRALLRMPPRPELLRPGPTISGPALMGLADVAVWAAVLGVTGGQDDCVTGTMTVTFLRPLGDRPVIAEARLVKRGRRQTYAEVWMRAEGDADAAVHATTTWVMIGRG